jgi:hypothetical protein
MNKILIFTTMFAFLTSTIQSENSTSMVFNEVITNVRLEKIVDKLLKQEKIGSTKEMIDAMLEAKEQVEHYLGTKISITHSISVVMKELDKKGHPISKDQLESLKKQISIRQKKAHFHKMYISQVLSTEGMEFNQDDERAFFDAQCDVDMKKHKSSKVMVSVHARVVYGFMLALCGVYIDSIPLTPDHVWGRSLIESGVGILCE